MTDIKTSYLGLELKNPIIAGASGLTSNLKMIKKLQESGAGAIVCKSLFQEEIQLEGMKFQRDLHKYDDIHPEMLTVFPELEYGGPKQHLFWLKKTKEETTIPVIGSLNAVDDEVWLEYSRKIEDTGVDALELNLYRIPDHESQSPQEVEENQLNILRRVKENVSIPVSVKLSPYYTNLTGFIHNVDQTGVDGVVLFNRLFAPDINISKEEHSFPFSFSIKEDNLLTQKYTGLLSSTTKGDICSSRGIMDGEDIVKMLLVGADAVQVVSTLYRNTHTHIKTMESTIKDWMEEKGYSTLGDFKGKLSKAVLKERKHWLYTRNQYVRMLMQSSDTLAEQIF